MTWSSLLLVAVPAQEQLVLRTGNPMPFLPGLEFAGPGPKEGSFPVVAGFWRAHRPA